MHHTYYTSGTCSRKIDFDLDGDVVHGVVFEGGCNGNLKAVSKLVEGQTVDYIVSKLAGNTCGFRPTSCADQLAKAISKAYASENKA
ncbi:MAG: TIGR03905 family TSCPD domain-containing protein [Clostridia bacterium]|nr:TIGR03905 family TSCPD domain-containing protein [Clostridia bacterium]